MQTHSLAKFDGSTWTGQGELWLDPEGNKADVYECQLQFKANVVSYDWTYKGDAQKGSFTLNESGATWTDSWHQPQAVNCINVPDAWGLFTVQNTYEVPSSPVWGWRSKLSERPGDTLVLQMTNITPWGEEGRAVRMIFSRD